MMRRALCVGMAIALLAGTLSICFSVGLVTGNSPVEVVRGTPHAPIRINSDGDFPGIATAGNGSAGNPWVIENFEIDGALSGNCIYVGNTTDYFIIQNCLLSNSSGLVSQPYISDAGIVLYNVQNGLIFNNTISNISGMEGFNGGDAAGVCLILSNNNTIQSNFVVNITGGDYWTSCVQGIGWGIYLDTSSDSNQIIDNQISSISAGSVKYFKDDIENGAGMWTHSSTLASINGESPLEYYFATDLDTDVVSDWNATSSVGITNTNTTYHSYNESFFLEEPVAGNSNKSAVTDSMNFTYHDSAILSFWHKYNLTVNESGAFLQIGYNQSGIWKWKYAIPANPYTGNLKPSEIVLDSFGTRIFWCWNGISGGGGYTWDYASLNIFNYVPSSYRDEVRVKFNYTQFGGVGSGDGWYLDDVKLTASRLENANIESECKDVWQITNTTSHSGNNCWSNLDPATGFLRSGIDNSLTTVPIDLTSVINANLTAYLRFNINEDNGAPPDGFRVEVSNDNGITWQAINMGVRAGWNVSGTGNDAEDGNATDGRAYSGLTDSGDALADDYWVEASTLSRINADLTSFAGNVIQIRFRVVTSNNVSYEHNNNNNCPDPGFGGFYLDDVEVRGIPLFELLDGRGIGITNSDDNQIYENNVSNCYYGAYSFGSVSNNIYHNNFVNNAIQARDTGTNFWDSGYPFGGNYWSDYVGSDDFHGPGQNIPGSDGLGDAHYPISGGVLDDNYPLMELYNGQLIGEAVPPVALNYSPIGNDAAHDSVIVIEWNETMNWTSVNASFSYTDSADHFNSSHGTWSHDSSTNVSTFTPADDFDYEIRYNVTVNCSATDVVGNALDQNLSGVGGEWPEDVLTWNFKTTDRAPLIMSTIPAHNQIEVPPDTMIKIIFSEEMNATSVEDAFSYSNATQTWVDSDGFRYWENGNTSFTFVPLVQLENNMTYTAHIDGAVAKDAGGKVVGPNYTWSFTTWTEPPLPVVIDVDPADGANGVPVNMFLNVEFDMAMDHASTENAFSFTDGSETWGGSDGSFVWSENNASFSFQPSAGLDHNTTYIVTVGGTASSTYGKTLDGDGDGVIGVDDSYSFSFTTALLPPHVVWTSPAEAETDVRMDIPAIIINFNTRMNIVAVDAVLTITPVVNHTNVWRGDHYNVTIVLDEDLDEGVFYQVKILATATDIKGTKLDGNGDGVAGDNFVLTFITEGANVSNAPYVVSVFPPPGNVSVPVNSFIGISFSTSMNRTSVENAFSFSNTSGPVNGTFSWSSATTLKFIPAVNLAYNTTYFVDVGIQAIDRNGFTLEEGYSWQFTTEGEGGPDVLSDNWWMIAIIVVLLVVISAQYLKNRGTEMQLRRARVQIKKLKKGGEPEAVEEGRSSDIVDEAPDPDINDADGATPNNIETDPNAETDADPNPPEEEGVPRQ